MPTMTPVEKLGEWYRNRARTLRGSDLPPASREAVARRAAEIRAGMRSAELEALRVESPAPLDPQVLGVLKRDGYSVERLLFQTRPGCYATANMYLPAAAGRRPAVLCVHGHWAGARMDPVVQSRCIGLAKLGFVVLTLDAWGAGERGTAPGQAEYHGGLLGASLWPVGTPLHGLQLYDNLRALDLLESRPEVDPQRIGCTGASGGGNQTTYLSAFDERVRCAVPVCSVGTFESYLEVACCVDEVLIGALTFAEEGDLLGIVAPRALMVITASQDSFHFGPIAAGQALARAKPYFEAHGAPDRVRHVVIESGHHYNQPMREAMYGWMRRWLMDEGDGSPVAEPSVTPEDPAAIRCFDPPFRSGKVMTTVRWVAQRASERVASIGAPAAVLQDERRQERLKRLREILALPAAATPRAPHGSESRRPLLFESEPAVEIPLILSPPDVPRSEAPTMLLASPSGAEQADRSPLAQALRRTGVQTAAVELRGCGSLALPKQALGDRIPDHNLVEWSLWVGRPLLGQWVHDLLQAARLLRTLPEVDSRRVGLTGWMEGGLAALVAGALEPELRVIGAVEALASFVSDAVPQGQRMVAFQPDLLRVGDIPHLAGLRASRPLLIANPVRMGGGSATAEELGALYHWTAEAYSARKASERFRTATGLSDTAAAEWLRDRLI